MKSVLVIDYGLGNILSVIRAIEHCGFEAKVSSAASEIESYEKIILPGVGSFPDGMRGLGHLALPNAIKLHAKKNKPILGICLGMQLLFDSSEEFGLNQGLGLISGTVESVPLKTKDGLPHPIPIVGWFELKKTFGTKLLQNIGENESAYFVHSFRAIPKNQNDLIATINYNGWEICAAVNHQNIFGCQFHPEKSGTTGLKILQNFLNL